VKAIVLHKIDGPEVLKPTEVPEPIPAKGEVLVRLQCIGINYAEILSRKGLYGWAPKRPYILGMEGAGIIEQVGEGVDAARVGQRVIVGTQYGCYAEKIAVPQERAIPAIEHFSMEENAAFAVNYLTAWVALFELARLQYNETLLITAAAGGVGSAACQLAAKMGCRVFGLAGSAEKVALVKSLGVKDAFNYREPGAFEKIRQASGGADVVLELVGGGIFKESFKLLNPFGRLVVAGFASLNFKWWNPVTWWQTWRDIPRAPLLRMAEKSVGVMATHIGYLLDQPQRLRVIFDDLRKFVTDKQIRPLIGKVFQFEQAKEAHAFIESRKSTGKILLHINSHA
jgi:NADPH2:quinone reductase